MLCEQILSSAYTKSEVAKKLRVSILEIGSTLIIRNRKLPQKISKVIKSLVGEYEL